MRWFKHLADASQDPKLQLALEEFGPAAVGIYFIILERVSAEFSPKSDPVLTISARKWAQNCSVSQQKFRKVARFLAEVRTRPDEKPGLLDYKESGKLITITVPNLRKYRDEYTKRTEENSGQAPDKLRTSSGQTPERLRYQNQNQNQNQSTEPPPEPERPDTTPDKNGGGGDVVLVQNGIPERIAKRAANVSGEYALLHLDYYHWWLRSNTEKNPYGYLVSSIEKGWGPPQGWVSEAEREANRQKAADRRRKQEAAHLAQKEQERQQREDALAAYAEMSEFEQESVDELARRHMAQVNPLFYGRMIEAEKTGDKLTPGIEIALEDCRVAVIAKTQEAQS